jgi:hypothetical protein
MIEACGDVVKIQDKEAVTGYVQGVMGLKEIQPYNLFFRCERINATTHI